MVLLALLMPGLVIAFLFVTDAFEDYLFPRLPAAGDAPRRRGEPPRSAPPATSPSSSPRRRGRAVDEQIEGGDLHVLTAQAGLSRVLRLLGHLVVAGGDQGAVHDQHRVSPEPSAVLKCARRPEVVDDAVGRRQQNAGPLGSVAKVDLDH